MELNYKQESYQYFFKNIQIQKGLQNYETSDIRNLTI